MKQLSALLVCLALLLSCCSCTALLPYIHTPPTDYALPTVSTKAAAAAPLPYDEAIKEGRYYYQALSPEQQENYDALYNAICETDAFDTDVSDFFSDEQDGQIVGVKVLLPYPLLDKDQLDVLYHAVLDDHPDIFYVISFAYKYIILPDNSVRYTQMVLRYFLNAEQRAAARQEIALAVSELTQGLDDPSYSEYDKELLIHDRLLKRCRYDDNSAELNELERMEEALPESFSAYGALCKGLAVCEGYTRAMMLLLDHVDICTVPVYSENHVWNLVWIDGLPYHLDATWNDDEDMVLHTYFNVTDRELLRGREIYKQTPALPNCTATDNAYFVRTGTDLSDSSEQEILESIAAQMEQYDRFELLFSSDNYETALDMLSDDAFFDELYPFVSDERLSVWSDFYAICNDNMCTIAMLF